MISINYDDYGSAVKEILNQIQDILAEEIQKLVNDGDLQVELGEPNLILDPLSDKIFIGKPVKLICTNKDTIKKLQEENKLLKDKLKVFTDLIRGGLNE